jgi:hypothetical protein
LVEKEILKIHEFDKKKKKKNTTKNKNKKTIKNPTHNKKQYIP